MPQVESIWKFISALDEACPGLPKWDVSIGHPEDEPCIVSMNDGVRRLVFTIFPGKPVDVFFWNMRTNETFEQELDLSEPKLSDKLLVHMASFRQGANQLLPIPQPVEV